MRPLSRIAFEVVLGAVLAASLATILRQRRRIIDDQQHIASDAQSLRMLTDALRLKELEKTPAPVTEEMPPESIQAALAKRETTIKRLDRELAQDRATIAGLQAQLSSASDQNAKALASAQTSLQQQQAETHAQLADLQKKLDAAISESDIARRRAAAVEADYNKLQTETSSGSTRAAEVAHLVSSLQDIERRREVYLTSILRRYRDISGEFRAMGSMLDASHDGGANPCNGATLSRIQNAVSMSEDDLTQVGELNARAQKLESQLLKK